MPHLNSINEFAIAVLIALASSSTIIPPQAVPDELPHVIVVPVNPEFLDTVSIPVAGVKYPSSLISVQLVGGVKPGGWVALPITPSVGFPVSADVSNVIAGVAEAWFEMTLLCFIALAPVLVMPDMAITVIQAPVALSPVQLNVAV